MGGVSIVIATIPTDAPTGVQQDCLAHPFLGVAQLVVDHDPSVDANLRCRKAHALRRVHEVKHASCQRLQVRTREVR